jgi:hypothetical protein
MYTLVIQQDRYFKSRAADRNVHWPFYDRANSIKLTKRFRGIKFPCVINGFLAADRRRIKRFLDRSRAPHGRPPPFFSVRPRRECGPRTRVPTRALVSIDALANPLSKGTTAGGLHEYVLYPEPRAFPSTTFLHVFIFFTIRKSKRNERQTNFYANVRNRS